MIHEQHTRRHYYIAAAYPKTGFFFIIGKASSPESFAKQISNIARADTIREINTRERFSLAGQLDVGLLPGVTAQNGFIE